MTGKEPKKYDDAFGEELRGYYEDKEDFEIIEREDGYFGAPGESAVYFSEFKDWFPIEKEAIKHAFGRVLDIGCGAGRHALYLQKKGCDVTGIDKSPLAIKIAKARGVKKINLMPIDEIGKFKRGSFDSIIMMGNNFGLFGGYKKAKNLLRIMYEITSDDSVLIFSTLDPYQTKEKEHLEYHRQNKARGRMGGQVRIRVRYKKFIGEWFDYLFVSRDEMKDILKDTGWKVVKFIKPKGLLYIAIVKKEKHI